MSSTEGTRSWEYLRRNPAYVEARRMTAEPAPEEPAPFPLRVQTAADREAAAWGLLAWEDPDDGTGPGSPFWADAPMLEAVPSPEAPALAELLKEPEIRLSGLRPRRRVHDPQGRARRGLGADPYCRGRGARSGGRDRASAADGAGPAGAAAPNGRAVAHRGR